MYPPRSKSNPGPATVLHGPDLLAKLQSEKSTLPNKTIVALVVGALRVRVMRSAVTMTSIVLAIAFLAYMGLSNHLHANVAQATLALERQSAAAADPAARQEAQRQAMELRRLLRKAGLDAQQAAEGSTSDTWLVVMALITCTVGIANAMLMSVTERFREIATMKCLGALDSLVVKLFLLESSLLGVTGAIAGIVLGVLVAVLAAAGQFGSYGLTYFPLRGAAGVFGWSVLSGILLPVLGAVYPALMAARMRPVDALRVDE